MATAIIKVSYPTTRKDGTPLPTARIGGAHILKQQPDNSFVTIGTVVYPSTDFVDPTNLTAGTYTYAASVFDTDPIVKEGDVSPPESITVSVDAAPSAPTITVTVS